MQINHIALDQSSLWQFSINLTPAATAAASAVEQAFTITAGLPALKATDQVSVTGPGSGNNVAPCHVRVNAAGQLVIQFVNPTAGALTHAAGVFIVTVVRA